MTDIFDIGPRLPKTIGRRLTTEEQHGVASRLAARTDMTADGALCTLAWFDEAVAATRDTGGLAALEIGVREGGTSAILCEASEIIAQPEAVVISVDPWGEAPYYAPDYRPKDYNEDAYLVAKSVLAPYKRSVLFRMEADAFLGGVLPTFSWWLGGRRFPWFRRFLSYSFVDGQHDPTSVVREAAALARFTAPGGRIVVDNTESVPSAVEMLEASQILGFSGRTSWQSQDSPTRREMFTVP